MYSEYMNNDVQVHFNMHVLVCHVYMQLHERSHWFETDVVKNTCSEALDQQDFDNNDSSTIKEAHSVIHEEKHRNC